MKVKYDKDTIYVTYTDNNGNPKEAVLNLTALVGTEKQIKWARELRAHDIEDKLNSKDFDFKEDRIRDSLCEAGLEALMFEEDAAKIIDLYSK